jgi:hypothetical protein
MHARIESPALAVPVAEAADELRCRSRGEPIRVLGERILPGMRLDAIDEFELLEYFEQQRPPGKMRYRTGTILSVRELDSALPPCRQGVGRAGAARCFAVPDSPSQPCTTK